MKKERICGLFGIPLGEDDYSKEKILVPGLGKQYLSAAAIATYQDMIDYKYDEDENEEGEPVYITRNKITDDELFLLALINLELVIKPEGIEIPEIDEHFFEHPSADAVLNFYGPYINVARLRSIYSNIKKDELIECKECGDRFVKENMTFVSSDDSLDYESGFLCKECASDDSDDEDQQEYKASFSINRIAGIATLVVILSLSVLPIIFIPDVVLKWALFGMTVFAATTLSALTINPLFIKSFYFKITNSFVYLSSMALEYFMTDAGFANDWDGALLLFVGIPLTIILSILAMLFYPLFIFIGFVLAVVATVLSSPVLVFVGLAKTFKIPENEDLENIYSDIVEIAMDKTESGYSSMKKTNITRLAVASVLILLVVGAFVAGVIFGVHLAILISVAALSLVVISIILGHNDVLNSALEHLKSACVHFAMFKSFVVNQVDFADTWDGADSWAVGLVACAFQAILLVVSVPVNLIVVIVSFLATLPITLVNLIVKSIASLVPSYAKCIRNYEYVSWEDSSGTRNYFANEMFDEADF